MRRIVPRTPLTAEALRQLALTYVGRFATSEAKLAAYLTRKVREHGWDGAAAPATAVADIVATMAQQRFVDDRAYADMKAQGLARRGYGPRRVRQALGAAGIEENVMQAALDAVDTDGAAVALAFARRRRLGPFSQNPEDPRHKARAFSAMMRAGHDYATVRRILDLDPEVVHNS